MKFVHIYVRGNKSNRYCLLYKPIYWEFGEQKCVYYTFSSCAFNRKSLVKIAAIASSKNPLRVLQSTTRRVQTEYSLVNPVVLLLFFCKNHSATTAYNLNKKKAEMKSTRNGLVHCDLVGQAYIAVS